MHDFIPVCSPTLDGNELKYVHDAVSTGWISSAGKYVQQFEDRFAAYSGCKFGVAVCNGTVALHLALVALGIKKGDEVIIPAFTMIASAFAVCYTGATPVFVDSGRETWNIDVNRIEKSITTRTKAIMAVHIFGQMCDMDKIKDIAQRYRLFVIEDAAEAHGAEYKGTRAGSSSDIAAFSFFANKIISTGEGGMVTTNNEELYDRSRYHKNLCFPLSGPRNYTHEEIGFNYRMSNVIAAIGLAQVEKADEYKEMRRHNNDLYRNFLKETPGIIFQDEAPGTYPVYWMNAIVLDPSKYGHSRDELIGYLKNNQVETRLLFTGMHHQKSLMNFGCDCSGKFPVSDWLTENGLYLPSASNLKEEEIEHISELISSFRK